MKMIELPSDPISPAVPSQPRESSSCNVITRSLAARNAVIERWIRFFTPIGRMIGFFTPIGRWFCFFFAFYVSVVLIVLCMYAFPREDFKGLEESNEHFFAHSIYFQVLSLTTVGYGDFVPLTGHAKIFSSFIVIIGVFSLNHFISSLVSKTFESVIVVRRYIFVVAFSIFVLGGVVIHFMEKLDFVDSFYFTTMSFTSVGHGDISFKSNSGRVFASVWLLLATIAWNMLIPIVSIIIKKLGRDSELLRDSIYHDLTSIFKLVEKKLTTKKRRFVLKRLKILRKITHVKVKKDSREFNQIDARRTEETTVTESPTVDIIIQH